MQTYGKIDSKFRFVILASKRAKQLLRGAKPKVKTRTRNPIRIAQFEVKEGLVDYDILQTRPEDLVEADEQVFTPDEEAEDTDIGAGESGESYDEEPAEREEEEGEETEELAEEEGGAGHEDE